MSLSQQNDVTCAVLVRGMYDEAPFLSEFVAHYMGLGFDHIYYINTQGEQAYVHSVIDAKWRSNVTVINLPSNRPDWQESVLNEAMPSIREDWFLNIDIDEFLYLDGRSIKQFLQSLSTNVCRIRFQWHMCLSTKYVQSSVFEITHDHNSCSRLYKSMARTATTLVCGIHDIAIRKPYATFAPVVCEDKVFIYHFACRGFYDLMNRIVGRNYQNPKTGLGEVERLIAFLRDPGISAPWYPFRFNLYRVELSFPQSNLKCTTNSAVPTDNDLLRLLFLEKMSEVGILIPKLQGYELDCYVEDVFLIKQRLTRDLPAQRYANMHLESGMSYINITREYAKSFELEIKDNA